MNRVSGFEDTEESYGMEKRTGSICPRKYLESLYDKLRIDHKMGVIKNEK